MPQPTGQTIERPPRRDYTDAEISAGLTALALYSGQRLKAAEALSEAGTPIPGTTLITWAKRWPERYRQAQQEAAPYVKAQMLDMHEGLAQAAGNIEWRIIKRLENELDQLKPDQLPTAIKSLGITGAVHTDKGLLYRGEPTQITRTDLTSLKRVLESKGITLEGTAEDVTDAVPVVAEVVRDTRVSSSDSDTKADTPS